MNQSGNYKNLTEKQIIKELKCLVAKQEKAIDTLLEQIQALKKQNASQYHPINHISVEKDQSVSNSIGSDRFNAALQSNLQLENSCDCELKNQTSQMDIIKSAIKDFKIQVLQPYQDKYSYKPTYYQSNGAKIPSPQKNKNGKSLKDLSFKSFKCFVETFPFFLDQITNLCRNLYSFCTKSHQKYKNLADRIKSQQKIIKEMIFQYQKNIVESQSVEKRLIFEIEKLRTCQSKGSNKFDTIEYRKQLYDY